MIYRYKYYVLLLHKSIVHIMVPWNVLGELHHKNACWDLPLSYDQSSAKHALSVNGINYTHVARVNSWLVPWNAFNTLLLMLMRPVKINGLASWEWICDCSPWPGAKLQPIIALPAKVGVSAGSDAIRWDLHGQWVILARADCWPSTSIITCKKVTLPLLPTDPRLKYVQGL